MITLGSWVTQGTLPSPVQGSAALIPLAVPQNVLTASRVRMRTSFTD